MRSAQLEDAIDDVIDVEEIERARTEFRDGKTVSIEEVKRSLRKR